jgi:Phosphoinositide phospholipase C, Ca2+-dependent
MIPAKRILLLTTGLCLAVLTLSNCSDPVDPTLTPAAPTAFGDLRYNEVGFKASHNAYAQAASVTEQLAWNPDRPWEYGSSGLELDLQWRAEAPRQWTVHHYDYETGRPLSDYLTALNIWSASHPGHRVITLDFEHKIDYPDSALIAGYFRDYLQTYLDPRRIFKPSDLLALDATTDHPDLQSAVRAKGGWPTLSELQDRFILVQNNLPASDPLCFARYGSFARFEDNNRNVLFYYQKISGTDPENWTMDAARIRSRTGLITRGYTVNACGFLDDLTNDTQNCGPRLWSQALTSGLNMIATDHINNGLTRWSMVGTQPMWPLETGRWRPARALANGTTSDHAPCPVVFRDTLHVFHTRNDTTLQQRWNGQTWLAETTWPDLAPVRTATVFQDRIHVVTGDTTDLTILTFAGEAWTPETAISRPGKNPVMCAEAGELHLVFADARTDALLYAVRTASGWTQPQGIPGAVSASRPALGLHDGQLHLFWRDESDQILWSVRNAATWRFARNITELNDAAATGDLAIGSSNQSLEVYYPNADTQSVWYFSLINNADLSAQQRVTEINIEMDTGIGVTAYRDEIMLMGNDGAGGQLWLKAKTLN